jgi:hypothetical protein
MLFQVVMKFCLDQNFSYKGKGPLAILDSFTIIIQKANYKLNYKNYPNIKYLLTSSWIAN